jgi:hypothetical protein
MNSEINFFRLVGPRVGYKFFKKNNGIGNAMDFPVEWHIHLKVQY